MSALVLMLDQKMKQKPKDKRQLLRGSVVKNHLFTMHCMLRSLKLLLVLQNVFQLQILTCQLIQIQPEVAIVLPSDKEA